MSYIGTNGGNTRLAQALPNWKWQHASQVGLHTTEFPVGHRLLALWQFLNTRTTHGAYQAGADSHGANGQYAPWSWAAWGAPSINRWAVHVAGNCRADEWDRMSATQRRNLINGMARQAHRFSRWQVSQGRAPVPARRLTRAQALRREAGFVYHGALQADRSDPTGPRNVFPWTQFLTEYRRLESGGTTPAAPAPVLEGEVMTTPKEIWDHREHDFVNDNPNSYGFMLARLHQYLYDVQARIRSSAWGDWLAGRLWRTRGLDYVNENPSTKDNQLARAHQYAMAAAQRSREANEKIDAVAEAVAALVGQIDTNTRKALEDKLASIRTESARLSAEEVAAELEVTVKEQED